MGLWIKCLLHKHEGGQEFRSLETMLKPGKLDAAFNPRMYDTERRDTLGEPAS